jgi:hypothetical protein
VVTSHFPQSGVATIAVACDNMYTMESKDELVFVDFFFIQYRLSFATNVSCNLSKLTNEIFVTNFACNYYSHRN